MTNGDQNVPACVCIVVFTAFTEECITHIFFISDISEGDIRVLLFPHLSMVYEVSQGRGGVEGSIPHVGSILCSGFVRWAFILGRDTAHPGSVNGT